MEDHQTAHDMIDVTDCLEARDAFRGMKNFCFWVMLICLLLLQGLFWLQRSGGIIEKGELQESAAAILSEKSEPETAVPPASSDPPASDASEPGTIIVNREKPIEPIVQAAQEVVQEIQASPAAETKKYKLPNIQWPPFHLSRRHASILIGGLNAALLFAAVLYCLVLVFILKVSLVSRLGGISHISRAFFVSLFLLVLLFPWQCVVPGVLLGTIYLPEELLDSCPPGAEETTLQQVLSYIRFVGLWIPAFWLLLWSAIRSGKWYQTTQRRLGIVA
ncbi:MAG: hypothetical protein WHS88_08380 [Anaerohalosphaeraceae bacterium]